MDWQDEYERKKITVNQVFEQHLTGNQKIYTGGLHVPTTIINALIDRVATGTLTGIDLFGNWMNGDITFAALDVTPSSSPPTPSSPGPTSAPALLTDQSALRTFPFISRTPIACWKKLGSTTP